MFSVRQVRELCPLEILVQQIVKQSGGSNYIKIQKVQEQLLAKFTCIPSVIMSMYDGL